MALLIGNVLRHAARYTPRRIAATHDSGGSVTFAELDERANRAGHALAALGVGHRDRVAWWGDTSLEALTIFFALAKLGAVFAPVNARLGADEAATVVGYARPRLLLADDERAGQIDGHGFELLSHAALDRAASESAATDVVVPRLDDRDPHVIFFTSGSTGRPKGVVLSHRANFLRSFPSLASDEPGGLVCMFPLFHMAGWSLALGCWQTRQPIHFVGTPDAGSLLGAVERHRAQRLYLIPAVWARVLEHGDRLRAQSSLRIADTGTSATPPELLHAIHDALPHTITRVFYGSTEAGAATVLSSVDVLRKAGSVGLPQPGVDVRLADDGEVCVHSELLMDGYFEQPDETADALRDCLLYTSDAADE